MANLEQDKAEIAMFLLKLNLKKSKTLLQDKIILFSSFKAQSTLVEITLMDNLVLSSTKNSHQNPISNYYII